MKKLAGFMGKFALLIYFSVFVLLEFAFRYLYRTPDSLEFLNFHAIFFTVLWALLFCGLIACLPDLGRKIAGITITIIICLVCCVHGVMYHMFGHIFSFADIGYAGDGAAFFSFEYVVIRKALIACMVLALAVSIVVAIGMPKKQWSRKRLIIGLVIMAVSVTGIAVTDHQILTKLGSETFNWERTHAGTESVYQDLSDTNRSLSYCGGYQYLFRSFVVTYHLDGGTDYEQMRETLDEYYAGKDTAHKDNEMSGVLEDQNLLMIMLESIDTWMINPDFMPNLYALQQESVDFENHYTPLFLTAGTFNTEFMANTGLVAPSTGASVDIYATASFPYSMAHLFTEKGYEANSFHSANPTVYNRGEIHENFGYEKYHSWVEMNMENYTRDSQLMNGFDIMTQGEKFFSFLITYSGHGPYVEDTYGISETYRAAAEKAAAKHPVDTTEENKEEYIIAIAHAMETDEMIGQLMEKLKESGRDKDTTLLLFTDHYSKYMTDRDFVMELKGAKTEYDLYRTPCMIYSQKLQAQKITKVTSTLDILPTVANLFGLDTEYQYYVGKDVFSGGAGFAPFPGNKFLADDLYYTPDAENLSEEVREMAEAYCTAVKMSADLVRSDYFQYRD